MYLTGMNTLFDITWNTPLLWLPNRWRQLPKTSEPGGGHRFAAHCHWIDEHCHLCRRICALRHSLADCRRHPHSHWQCLPCLRSCAQMGEFLDNIFSNIMEVYLLLRTSVYLRSSVGPRVAILRKIRVYLSTFSRATKVQQKADAMGSCFHRCGVFDLFHSLHARIWNHFLEWWYANHV